MITPPATEANIFTPTQAQQHSSLDPGGRLDTGCEPVINSEGMGWVLSHEVPDGADNLDDGTSTSDS